MMNVRTPEEIRTYQRAWRARNADAIRQRHAEYYAANRDKLIAYGRAYNKTYRERRRRLAVLPEGAARRRALAKQRRAIDPEATRRKQREYFAKNRARILAKNREYYRRNAKHIRSQKSLYYQATVEQRVAVKKLWALANAEKLRDYRRRGEHNRRARLRLAQGRCSKEQLLARILYYGWHCAYCSAPLNESTVTIDHRIPLCRGGSGWPSNLVPACAHCNKSKNRKLPREFSPR